MAMSGRQTNTMTEFMQKMLRLITDAKATPDTDLEFLVNLETTILQQIRGPLEQAGVDTSAMQDPMAAAQAGGMPPNVIPMAQGAGAVPQGPPVGARGMQTSTIPDMSQLPNDDELRRLLTVGG